jgi:hypothetical protein
MQSSSAYIPSFSLSKFSETVTAPYTSLAAFSSGVIDANGNLLKPESSIDPYEYFIIKLKKIFDQLPMSYTKARLASYVSTFQMFNEEAESFGLNSNEFLFFIEGYLESGLLINEDMGTGMISGGGAPGTLGTPQDVKNTGAVMGYDKPLEAPMFTRLPVEMFDVDDKEFKNFKNAKAWKHIPDSETKRYLKRFQQRNPSGKMAIRSNKDIHWISYPAKSFVEEYDLEFLDILNESFTEMLPNNKDQLESKSKKTLITMKIPKVPERLGKETENAFNLFGNSTVQGSNVTKENAMLGAIEKKLQSAGYKLNNNVTHKSELKVGEYSTFGEGGVLKDHSDIHVGMAHPEKKGEVYPLGIESGYSISQTKPYLMQLGTHIKIPKILKRLGLTPTSSSLATKEEQINVGDEIIERGTVSDSKKRIDLWPSLKRLFPKTIEHAKQLFRPMAHEAIRTKSDDISVIGHTQRVSTIHHRKNDTFQRELAQQLLDQMNMHHTHDLDELTLNKSPSYGGSQKKKESQ